MGIRTGKCLKLGFALWFVAATSGALAGPSPTRLTKNWEDLTVEERKRALKNYRRFQELPPAEKEQVRERYRRWKNLPREDRDRLRERHRKYRELPERERQRLRDRVRDLLGRD